MSTKFIKSKFWVEDIKEEMMAEVPISVVEPWQKDKELKYVGKPESRKDAYDKVSGTAEYTFDKSFSQIAVAKTLRSPYPNAVIKKIDVSEAIKNKNVLGILTPDNCKDNDWYSGTSKLLDKKVRYNGDEIACIVAETEQDAEEALRLIKIEYEILPHVTDLEKAKLDTAAKINDHELKPREYNRGNLEEGLKEADIIVEDKFSTSVAVHNPLEPHCSVVKWDGEKLLVFDSTQGIWAVRDTVASQLGIPASNVRVIKKYMGGGFGGKLECGKYTVMAALLSKKIGRPVKIVLDRKEMNQAVGNRPSSVQELKIGAKKDGSITAISHNAYGTAGAFPGSAGCSWPARSLYKCPNMKLVDTTYYINAGKDRPFRAPGHVQGTFAFESIIDEAAEKLGMDPIEFRVKNFTAVDPDWNGPYTSKLLREAYIAGADKIRWKENRKKAGFGGGIVKTGYGMASQIWWGGGAPPSYAILKLNWDGSAELVSGTQDIGTGTYTILAQIVAEVLEIPTRKINVVLGDTGVCPFGAMSGGSMTAPSVGPAARDAAEKMLSKLKSAAAAILELSEDKLEYSEGVFSSKDDRSKTADFSKLFGHFREGVLVTQGAREANPEGYAINTFGAQFAKVDVNTLTGKVCVKHVVAAHDIGRVLNRKTLNNQFHGGIMMGLGFALLEERVIDNYTGKLLTTNLLDYKLPTIIETPEIDVIIVSEEDNKVNNIGAKGIGEPAMIPTAGAIANAVYNAIGVRIKDLPITPDKVLNALASKNN
ncbi:MAG: xanthine dehydrogenase family protein molybdopterin-binding subunit [Melioribacteraceae bacterium]|nr:xanthine dehydrogenase family protein molybdopterin-binding subunit [Melioribacteraceae bacterium]